MSTTANSRTPSPGATLITNTPPDRDHAADSDDSLARKRQRLSEDPDVRIEADEPEDLGAGMDTAIVIEDDQFVDADAYSDTFQTFHGSVNMKPFDDLLHLRRLVAGDGMYFVGYFILRHPFIYPPQPHICAI